MGYTDFRSITVSLYNKIAIGKYKYIINTRNGDLFSKHLLSAYKCRGWGRGRQETEEKGYKDECKAVTTPKAFLLLLSSFLKIHSEWFGLISELSVAHVQMPVPQGEGPG